MQRNNYVDINKPITVFLLSECDDISTPEERLLGLSNAHKVRRVVAWGEGGEAFLVVWLNSLTNYQGGKGEGVLRGGETLLLNPIGSQDLALLMFIFLISYAILKQRSPTHP